MLRTIVTLSCLSIASAFLAPLVQSPSGLALRRSQISAGRSAIVNHASARRSSIGPKMQIQELAESALLTAAYPAPLVDGVTAYMNLYVPIFKSLNLPPFLLHWFHALNMGFVLAALGSFGTYLGWTIRSDPKTAGQLALADQPTWFNLGKTTAELHQTLMGGMAVIFFLGANGGLVLSLVQDKPIMQSAHFTSALVGFALLAAQAALTTQFKGETAKTAKTVHAFLGSATMAVFLFHAYQGLQLGLSLESAAPVVAASLN